MIDIYGGLVDLFTGRDIVAKINRLLCPKRMANSRIKVLFLLLYERRSYIVSFSIKISISLLSVVTVLTKPESLLKCKFSYTLTTGGDLKRSNYPSYKEKSTFACVTTDFIKDKPSFKKECINLDERLLSDR